MTGSINKLLSKCSSSSEESAVGYVSAVPLTFTPSPRMSIPQDVTTVLSRIVDFSFDLGVEHHVTVVELVDSSSSRAELLKQ